MKSMTLGKDADGHVTLGGSRWHVASKDDPTRCKEDGCQYVMGSATLVPSASADNT